MSANLLPALNALVERIVSLAAQDAQLRSELRVLARAILEATEETQETPLDTVAPLPEVRPEPEPEVDFVERGSLSPPEVSLSPSSIELNSRAGEFPERLPSWGAVTDDELPLIETRCRLKAEACRWVVRRQQMMRDGSNFRQDIEPIDHDIIDRAKALPDCYLWMIHGSSRFDAALSENVACCFASLADAAALVHQITVDPGCPPEMIERSLYVLAEAQSALWAALGAIVAADADQKKVHEWLRSKAREQGIFIQRYMRFDDPANPAGSSDLAARIMALGQEVQQRQQREKHRRKLVQKVRHKVKVIASGDTGTDLVEEWRGLAATLDQLVEGGMPPSNRDIRDLLLPVLDDMPEWEEMPAGFLLILREIDRYLLLARQLNADEKAPRAPSQEIQDVARLLKGRSIVLIGGERRFHAQQLLKTAFGLSDVVWIETREHQSYEPFEAYIARPEVALVILAIRWSSHAFGDVSQFCNRHGKPLVRLPAGYNPNQVAVQILEQCSDRLAAVQEVQE
jgi:hypothetical protein